MDRSLNRRRSQWRRTAPFADIVAPLFSVIFRAGNISDRLAVADPFLEQLLEEGTTPTATGPGTKAVAQLPRTLRFLDANEVRHLASRDVEAKTDFTVEIQRPKSF